MFVRVKKHKSKKGVSEYAYIVNNVWTEKGARQKVSKYLGKVINLEPKEEKVIFDLKELLNKDAKTLVLSLVRIELIRRGFKEENEIFVLPKLNLNIDLNKVEFKSKNGKNFVIKANEGFICRETLTDLLNFIGDLNKINNEKNEKASVSEKTETEIKRDLAESLASKLLEAGLPANENYFLILHKKLKGLNTNKEGKNEAEEDENEFYY